AGTSGTSGLDFFGHPVTYDGGTGSNSIVLDDSTNGNSDTYTITSTTVSRHHFGGLTYSNVQSLTLDTETGSNTVNVMSTSAGVEINNTGGVDSVYVGSKGSALGGTAQNIKGSVDVSGAGSTALYVDDHADTTGQKVTLSDGAITGLAP